MKADMAGEMRQPSFHKPRRRVFAGKVVDDDDRPARDADPAHLRGEACRDRARPRRHRAPIRHRKNCRRIRGVRHPSDAGPRHARAPTTRCGAWPFPASRPKHRSRSPANRAGNAAATARCRHRLRECAAPADHWRSAPPPCAPGETPGRKRCRKSLKKGDRSGSYRASPLSRSRHTDRPSAIRRGGPCEPSVLDASARIRVAGRI